MFKLRLPWFHGQDDNKYDHTTQEAKGRFVEQVSASLQL
jgi:hypothetical protein